jgi:nicotinate-nucleotide--dimethylbenzimidazole phosphoribosyltransferase
VSAPPPSSGAFERAAARVAPLDETAVGEARERHDRLAKPPGALGGLETLGVTLAGIAGRCPPPIPEPAAVAVFAADHGVVASGVSAWPRDVTALMVECFAAGGAAINAIARQVGAQVHVVDVGVAADLAHLRSVRHRKVRAATADLHSGAAMTRAEASAALDVGASVAAELVAQGARLLVTGDMGIGNTTSSAALVAVLADSDAARTTGRGAGADDAVLARKREVVAAATDRARRLGDPLEVLADVGGLEIAALAGFVVGGVAARVPVLVDGLIALAGTLVAHRLAPGVAQRCIAGHRSPEPGASVALEHLGLAPVLDLGLRLGEGTGGCLAVPLVQAAARVLAEMATLEELGVGAGEGPPGAPV